MSSDNGGNLWHASAREGLVAPALDDDVSADLVVVGGGFTGCSAALEAAEHGAKVVLLEAQGLGHGGSGRNVGLVNAGLWLPPDEVIKVLGQRQGTRLIIALSDGPQKVFDLIDRHGIACEATRNGTLHLAHAPSGWADLQERFRQGNRFGAPLQLLDAEQTAQRTGSQAFHGALFDPRAGTIQPLSYCLGLARAAQEAGASVHCNTVVQSMERTSNGWHVRAGNNVVRAKSLLIATNAYHRDIGGCQTPQFVKVNYCQFATAPLPADLRASILPGHEGCWDTAMVMSSLRTDRAGRLIIGGIGDADGPGGTVHRRWAYTKLAGWFPQLAGTPIEHVWSGRIAMTSDHVPKIVDIGDDALAVFGYSGRGISPGTTFGSAAAAALIDPSKRSELPVGIDQTHNERFAALRSGYYELGAIVTHAWRAATKG